MQVLKYHNSEYPIGILWNMGNKYAREMMLKIALMEDVLQVKILDLGKDYEQFVLDCYEGDEEAYEDGYIYEKVKNMNTDNKRIVVFIFNVDNPTYQHVEEAKRTLNTVNKYDKYTIGNYVRKGYKSILNESTKCQSKSYVSFLENLRGDKDERE